jgi:coenzyme PQQ precursor peptide PqqA
LSQNVGETSNVPCCDAAWARTDKDKDLTGEVFFPHYFVGEDGIRPVPKESQMAWKAPKIVEVPVGMEINMYACAARK